MAYREVNVFDVKEVLRRWLRGDAKKAIARQVGVDPKTVRRYVSAAGMAGLTAPADEAVLTDAVLGVVMGAVQLEGGRPRGPGWDLCEGQHEFIADLLKKGVVLTKIRKLLLRKRRVQVSYGTLRRYAMERLGFSEPELSIPVADGKPGEEVQVDTGWMTYLEREESGRRRFRAWIFTPVVSRYRFVYPVFSESTATAIEACEAAWAFYGGVFRVIVPDNTKAIVVNPDAVAPGVTRGFQEYVQARGFFVDPARVEKPKDKARVENAVRTVRNDCFGGEKLLDLAQARAHALWWCNEDYGAREHRTTRRAPREHFLAEEKSVLLPAPNDEYDVPHWCRPKVDNRQLAPVLGAVYSVQERFAEKKIVARADRSLVRFYENNEVVKVHPRQPKGGRSIDPSDYPAEKAIYAFRNREALLGQAKAHGEEVGRFAAALLESPEPWARMRRAYRLLRLVKRYGVTRVEEACATANAAQMLDVHRLEQMLAQAVATPPPAPRGRVVPIARYLRPAAHFGVKKAEGGTR